MENKTPKVTKQVSVFWDPPQKFKLQMCECHQTINVFTAFRNQRNAKYSVFTRM